VKDPLASEGSSMVARTPEYLGTHIRQEIAKWQKVVKDAHIRLDASR
jgi:tripartite-type tricarboxylate transporter receptor subunit TctC